MKVHTALIALVAMLAASPTSGVSAAATAGAEAVDITVPATTDAEPEATRTRDIVYLEMDGHEHLIDVYVPAGAGPWPVVVALHGAMVYKDHPQTTVVAQAAAEAGMLVFAPNWVAGWPSLGALDAEFIRAVEPAYRCALAYAQQEAASYGVTRIAASSTAIQGVPRPGLTFCSSRPPSWRQDAWPRHRR